MEGENGVLAVVFSCEECGKTCGLQGGLELVRLSPQLVYSLLVLLLTLLNGQVYHSDSVLKLGIQPVVVCNYSLVLLYLLHDLLGAFDVVPEAFLGGLFLQFLYFIVQLVYVKDIVHFLHILAIAFKLQL